MTEMAKKQPTEAGTKPNTLPGIQSPGSVLPNALGEKSAPGVVHQAKEMASHVATHAKDLVAVSMAEQTGKSAKDLGDVAKALRETSKQLDGNSASPYVEKAADQLDKLSQFLRTTNAHDIGHTVEDFARREPLLFLGGAFALGLLGARFVKSSSHHVQSISGDQEPLASVDRSNLSPPMEWDYAGSAARP